MDDVDVKRRATKGMEVRMVKRVTKNGDSA
jgi:hypothetical protein